MQANPRSPLLDDNDLRTIPWSDRDLVEGETFTGRVLRLPVPGAFHGSRLFVVNPDEVIGLRATSKSGFSVLERELTHVDVGDKVEIVFHGWRTTRDGERRYRHYEVRVL
jgi:hypothetical protein